MSEHVETRWRDDRGISDLSIAIDEIYFLRAVLADEAGIVEAHLTLKTFPKSRRKFAEEQVERMQRIARGEGWDARRDGFKSGAALRRVGADDTLTNRQWAAGHGLIEATPAPTPAHPSEEADRGC